MNNSGLLIFLVGLFFSAACSSILPSKATQDKKAVYDEDITVYRAQAKLVEVKEDTIIQYVEADSTSLPVTEKLNTVLDTAAAYNRANIKFVDGFTIQVYGGNDRTAATDYQLDIIRNFPDVESKMVFEQPNYKVRIGQYYTRLEAQEFFKEVRTVFPRAILIPMRIYIRN
jgi:hypothetical protein